MRKRRMVSMRVVDSDLFLDMPMDAQLLYFHLAMRAEDDGFITPKKVMRLIGCSDAAFALLVEKGFITIVDDNLACRIRRYKYDNSSWAGQRSKSKLCIQQLYYTKVEQRE